MSTESRPTGAVGARAAAGGGWLTPGVILGRGRYRLLEEVGVDDRCAARLWRGRDSVLERDVALTLFLAEPGDEDAAATITAATQRALRGARLESAGAARVLDVLEPEQGSGPSIAAVVAEWTLGRDLVAVARDGLPPPSVAAHMLAPLAGAVDDAHRAGLVLGCDHPSRIRIGVDGHARLAFPGPPAETDPRDDVRGLGAVLYLLLTGRWALPGGPDGLPIAPRGPEGAPASPRSLRSTVPLQLSTLALRSLAGSGANGLHTGAAVQRVLQRGASAGGDEAVPPGEPAPRSSVWHEGEVEPEEPPDRKRKRHLGIAALLSATLLILGWFGYQIVSAFVGDDPAVVIDAGSDGQPRSPGQGQGQAQPAAMRTVQVAELSVYDPSGKGAAPDNAEDVELVADGDPGTTWSTDSYLEQFPAYKPGLGVLLRFAQPVTPRSVVIASPSPGTEVQIRAAPAADAELSETTVLATATLQDGRTVIPLPDAPRTAHLLVWITKMTPEGEDFQSALGEVTVRTASRAG